MKKILINLIIAWAVLFSASGTQAGTIEEVLDRGVLRVGLSGFPPWAMQAKDGTFIGFEVDVATRMAADMGVAIEIVPTAWDGIIPALLAKKFDLIIGGMSITPARNLRINFSIPYEHNGIGLVANKARMGHATGSEDFNNEKVIFVLRRGTTTVEFVKELMPKAEIRQYDDDAAILQELLNDRADAWVEAEAALASAVADHPDKLFLPFAELLSREAAGIAMRKGDADAVNFINNWIRVKTNERWLQERHHYWFKTKEWAPLVGGE